MPDYSSTWTMVQDNVTGLIWEVKQDKDGVKDYDNPHDADNEYTWYDSNPETNGGYIGMPGNNTDTEDFINALNAKNFGNHDDWRMPTAVELANLINKDRYDPSIDINWFHNTIIPDSYWAGTPSADILRAFSIHYKHGYVGTRSERLPDLRSCCLWHSHPFNIQDDRNGTVTDTGIGLMWQKATAPGTYTWLEALGYTENLNLGGHTDWRLPNIMELQTLVKESRSEPAIDINYFPDTFAPYYYWSSTTWMNGFNAAQCQDFEDGEQSGTTKLSHLKILAVRSVQSLPPTQYTLSVAKDVTCTGTGAISSSPTGINCGSDCSESYSDGTTVILTAIPMTGSTFIGWSGAYSGTENPCPVTITGGTSIMATFSRLYTREELDAAISSERSKWDANGDNKIGLEEAIRTLQVVSGLE